jgi:hypothetical protein
MRALSGFFLSVALLAAAAVAADSPVRINAQGPFTDVGVWMYQTSDNKFRNGDGVKGTNESLIMPSPAPQYGETLVGITHIHHPRDNMGYPVHLSLIEKAFANIHKIQIFSSGSDNMLWRYDSGTPFGQEHGEATGPGRNDAPPSYKMTGPTPANGPIPPAYADAFAYLKGALGSIENMPAAQKDISNYVVLFAETGDTIWMEIAPNPAPGESVHLGCQMQNGRDMVFGYEKQSANGGHGGPWLQCF